MCVIDVLLELDGKQCCNLHLNRLYLTHMLSLFFKTCHSFFALGNLGEGFSMGCWGIFSSEITYKKWKTATSQV